MRFAKKQNDFRANRISDFPEVRQLVNKPRQQSELTRESLQNCFHFAPFRRKMLQWPCVSSSIKLGLSFFPILGEHHEITISS